MTKTPTNSYRTAQKRWSLMPLLRLATAASLLIVVWLAGGCGDQSSNPNERRLTAELIEKLRRQRALPDIVVSRMQDDVLAEEIAALDSEEEPTVSQAYDARAGEAAPRPLRKRFGKQLVSSFLMHSSQLDTAPATPAQWIAIGPNIDGGRTRSIVIDPANPQRIWAGSSGGGVWLSEDGGRSYRPLNDQLPSMVISCMVMRPGEPGVIYAGTGENFFATVDGPRGVGILKIKGDGSWEQLKGTDGADFHYVLRLAFSPDGSVLLAGTSSGLRRTTNLTSGVWEKSPELNFKVGEVLFDPRDGQKALAGGLDNGEIFFSSDGGKSWEPATHPDKWDGRIVLTYARANSAIVYASVPVTGDDKPDAADEIWASTDGGKTYSKRGSRTPDTAGVLQRASYSPNAKFSSFVWAGDPTDEKLVITGGSDIWRSIDGGEVLTLISTWQNLKPVEGKHQSNIVHIDQHCAVADPNYDGKTNRRVYFCNDGGVYKTEDILAAALDLPYDDNRADWQSLNNGYAVTQFHSGAGHEALGNIIGGTQDNGTRYLPPVGGANNWVEAGSNTGDGGFTAVAPSDGKLFSESQRLRIFRIKGSNPLDVRYHEYIHGRYTCVKENKPAFCYKPRPYIIEDAKPPEDEAAPKVNWVAPFMLDPNDDRRLLAGGFSLWLTENSREPVSDAAGPVWSVIKEPLADKTPISALAVVKGNSNVIWVAYNNGDLYQTTSGGGPSSSWTKLDDNGADKLPQRMCTRLILDPSNGNVAFASFGGYNADNVWKTTDGGTNWKSVSAGLPTAPVLALIIHPSNSNRIFAGTAVGAYASTDGGKHWLPFSPTTTSVNDLFWIGDTLVAATYGRGMFKIRVLA